jgi:Ankyrin repeats (3 copies)/Ankyrin repeats (many copies)
MATITITGPIELYDDESCEPITDPKRLKACNGTQAKGVRLADDLTGDLANLGIAGGNLKLPYDAKQKCLLVATTYNAPRQLSTKHLKKLVVYTRDQWSDGGGEGAFYKLMDKYRVGIDLAPTGSQRNTRALQSDVGGGKLKPTQGLVVAAQKGDLAKVERLLASGADINSRGQYRQTALQKAILYEHFQLATLLIDRGANVNATDQYGDTPLATAVMSGNLAVVRRLIKTGANVNCADKEGVTPLMWAANRGSAPIVKLLLEHGGDPNAKNRVKDNEGGTPLTYVQSHKHQEIIDLLIAHGAKREKR